MSFEKLYEKYRNGTASEEEIAYVEEEIAKARKLGEILESSENGKGAILPCGKENEKSAANGIFADADAEQVKKARKKHRLRSSVLTLCISLYRRRWWRVRWRARFSERRSARRKRTRKSRKCRQKRLRWSIIRRIAVRRKRRAKPM